MTTPTTSNYSSDAEASTGFGHYEQADTDDDEEFVGAEGDFLWSTNQEKQLESEINAFLMKNEQGDAAAATTAEDSGDDDWYRDHTVLSKPQSFQYETAPPLPLTSIVNHHSDKKRRNKKRRSFLDHPATNTIYMITITSIAFYVVYNVYQSRLSVYKRVDTREKTTTGYIPRYSYSSAESKKKKKAKRRGPSGSPEKDEKTPYNAGALFMPKGATATKKNFQKLQEQRLPSSFDELVDKFKSKVNIKYLQGNPLLSAFRDVSYLPVKRGDVSDFPFFWFIPPNIVSHKLRRVFSECFDLTQAEIEVPGQHGVTYQSQTRNTNKEQMLSAANLFEVHNLFNEFEPDHKQGRMFAFFLHPVSRAAYLFENFKAELPFRPDFDQRIKDMDLITYARFLMKEMHTEEGRKQRMIQDHVYRISNWMTRNLAQVTPGQEITIEHVDVATVVLKQKCLVGMYDQLIESMSRLLHIFRWDVDAPGGKLGAETCILEYLDSGVFGNSTKIHEGSEEWSLLVELNRFDMALYENVKRIFEEQGRELDRFYGG